MGQIATERSMSLRNNESISRVLSAAAQVIGDGVFTLDTDEQKEQKKNPGGASSLDPAERKFSQHGTQLI